MSTYPDAVTQLLALGILLVMIPFITIAAVIKNARRRCS